MKLKQFAQKSISFILCLLFLCSLSACKEETGTAVANMENTSYTAKKSTEINILRYKPQYSFYDEDSYYYVFYLGYVIDVPLQSNVEVYRYSGNDYSKELTTSVTESQMLSQSLSLVETNCVTYGVEGGISGTLGGELLGAKLDAGITSSISNSYSLSRSKTYTNAITYSETQSNTTKFVFTKDAKEGYYRYILLGEVDVFGILVKNIETGEYYTDTYEVIASQYFDLQYSASSRFDDSKNGTLDFSLSKEEIQNLQQPTTPLPPFPPQQTYYDSGYEVKKIDASYEYTYDEIDLSQFSQYMTSDFEFQFNLEILMKEEYAGYQEIYVCKDDKTHVGGESAFEFGGLGSAHKAYDWARIVCTIDGENCTPKMLLRYGAHGDHSDDWYRAHVKATITVVEKSHSQE